MLQPKNLSENWHNTFDIPEMFSTMTNRAIQSGDRLNITDRMRDEIIRSLSSAMLQYTITPTPEQYTTACKRLIEKFPILEDVCGKGNLKFVRLSKYTIYT